MAYIEQSAITGLLPEEFQLQALDDDADGAQDSGVWASVLAAAEDEINGRIGQRYTVPLSGTIPAVVQQAAKVLVLFFIYKRRGVAEALNPWAEDARLWREKLDKIGAGELPLTASAAQRNPRGSVIGEASKLFEASGANLV